MLRMAPQARVVNSFDALLITEPLRECLRVLAVAGHSKWQRLDTSGHQITVEGRRDRTTRTLNEAQVFADLTILTNHSASDHVAVAVEVLRHGMHHDVSAELERALEERRRKGVVDD
jgi:hypothetical protein